MHSFDITWTTMEVARGSAGNALREDPAVRADELDCVPGLKAPFGRVDADREHAGTLVGDGAPSSVVEVNAAGDRFSVEDPQLERRQHARARRKPRTSILTGHDRPQHVRA